MPEGFRGADVGVSFPVDKIIKCKHTPNFFLSPLQADWPVGPPFPAPAGLIGGEGRLAGTARRPCGRLPRGAAGLRGVVAFYSLSCGRPYPGVPVMNDDASKWSPRPPPLGLLAVGTLYLHSKDQDHLPVPQDQSHEPLQPPRHRAA